MHQDIAERLVDISSKIQKACNQAKRSESDIRLVAVSKLQSAEVIKEAYALGINNFGENYAQELAEKSLSCPNDIIWHFIGPIQSKKVSVIAKHAHWVHSIDREKVAMKLNKALESEGKKIHALIQVNIDHEASKSGILPEETDEFIRFCQNDCGLNIIGLMCIPPIDEAAAMHFALLRQIARRNDLAGLSMGMSADFAEAIAFGATSVRVGSAIFGMRDT